MYAKANWTSLKEVAVNLSSTIVESKDTTATEELWNIFKTTLQDAVKEHIPHKTTRAKISQPWVTAEIHKLIHKRASLQKDEPYCPETVTTELPEIHEQHLHRRKCEQPDYEEQAILEPRKAPEIFERRHCSS